MKLRSVVAAITLGIAALVAAPAAAEVQVVAYSYSPPEVFGGINVASRGVSFGGTTGRFLSRTRHTTTGAEADIFTFCIDVETGYYTFVDYAVSPLSAGFANPTKQAQIAALLTHGNPLIDAAATPADKSAIAAAIGLSIWEIVYETATAGYDVSSGNFNVYGDFVPLAARANFYLANVESGAWTGNVSRVRTLIDISGYSQNQVYLLGGVPEPTTWALMIVGFGMVGAALRRRRGGRARGATPMTA